MLITILIILQRIIMKTITLLFIPFIVFASGMQLTPSEHSSIHNANHRPSVKLKKKAKMHQLHNINEKEAVRIAKEVTGEEKKSLELTHRGQYLIYKIKTENYHLTINALDGTVIEKGRL